MATVIYNLEDFAVDNLVSPYFRSLVTAPWNTNEYRSEKARYIKETRKHITWILSRLEENPEVEALVFNRLKGMSVGKYQLCWYWAIDTEIPFCKKMEAKAEKYGFAIHKGAFRS